MCGEGGARAKQNQADASVPGPQDVIQRPTSIVIYRVHRGTLKLRGAADSDTLVDATRLADALLLEGCYREARSFSAQQSRVARRVLGSENQDTLTLRRHYAVSLYNDDVSRLNEALAILEDSHQTARRVFGDDHPFTRSIQHKLSEARECRAADDAADAAR